MFHKVRDVEALPGMKLLVRFVGGTVKTYNVGSLPLRFDAFRALEDVELFETVKVDTGGCGIAWTDDIDLSCDELWDNGIEVNGPLD